jgi:hypothetical protein
MYVNVTCDSCLRFMTAHHSDAHIEVRISWFSKEKRAFAELHSIGIMTELCFQPQQPDSTFPRLNIPDLGSHLLCLAIVVVLEKPYDRGRLDFEEQESCTVTQITINLHADRTRRAFLSGTATSQRLRMGLVVVSTPRPKGFGVGKDERVSHKSSPSGWA